MAKKTDPTITTDLANLPEAALAMTPDRPVVVEDDADYRDIRDLTARYGAVTFPGANMVPKLHLLGLPFIIVGLKFQKAMRTEIGGRFRDYVTVDAFVADEATVQDALDKGRVMKSVGRDAEVFTKIEDLPVAPEERIMFNDGSTGVRRQIVELLHRVGLVKVAEEEDIRESNANGRRVFDTAWNQWIDPAASGVPSYWTAADETEVPGYRSFADGRPLIVAAPRGLTGSVYPSEAAPSGYATTFYVR